MEDWSVFMTKTVKLTDKSNDYYDFVNHRKINIDLLQSKTVKKAYLLWYPLIAACSFIRANKQDPFAPEPLRRRAPMLFLLPKYWQRRFCISLPKARDIWVSD